MSPWPRPKNLLRNLLRKERVESDLEAEVGAYLDQLTEEKMAAGMSPEQARRAARIELGGVEQVKLQVREARAGALLEQFAQDIRYGLRTLRRAPGFTLVAALTLALGIGANTAIFSVVHAVLLRPLALPEPERVVTFWLTAPAKGLPEANLTDAHFAYLRERSRTLESVAAYEPGGFILNDRGEPEVVDGVTVTLDYFRVLGVTPLYGRAFLPEENSAGKNNVVILSHELWQRRFGGDVTLLGQSIRVDNVLTALVGIMPPGFDFPNPAERPGVTGRPHVWTLRVIDPQDVNSWNLSVVGRLKPKLTNADAHRELAALTSDYFRESAAEICGGSLGRDATTVLVPLGRRIFERARMPLVVLLCSVGLILLIACANVANLLLTRATARTREIALRSCLGASTPRILRQLLTESLLLSLLGTIGGLLLAYWCVAGLRQWPLEGFPRLDAARVDTTVLLFTLALGGITSLLFGLAPALRAVRVNLQESLKEGARGTASGSHRRLNNLFVVTQFALSLVLLVGAGLLLQSLRHLLAVDPGFRAENVLSGGLWLPPTKYPATSEMKQFYDRLLERVQNLPGVQAAGLTNVVPFSGGGDGAPFTVADHLSGPGEPAKDAWWRSVTPNYFAAVGIPILRGRGFLDSDTDSSQPVAIVDEKIARLYWPDEDPIGKQVRIGGASSTAPWLTVVGVVPNVKNRQLEEDTKPTIYQPLAQWVRRDMSVAIRSAGNPEAFASALRAQVTALDAELPMFQVETLEQAVARSVTSKQLTNGLLAAFAAMAMLLASVGIYGVMSLNVSSRVREFGIRMALGAGHSDVLWLVVSQGMRLALVGLAVGLIGALWLSGFLNPLLFQIKPTDPFTLGVVTVVLAAAAFLACWIPARRATKVDPVVALRYE